MKRTVLFLCALVSFVFAYGQNRPSNSLYGMNNHMVNPAVSGLSRLADVRLGYRNQWSGFDGAPKTFNFSFHTPLGRNFSGGAGTPLSREGSEARLSNFYPFNTDGGEIIRHSGLGGNVFSDKTGAFGRTQAALTYAYHMPLGRELGLAAGVSAGYSQNTIDFSKIDLGPMDPSQGSGLQKDNNLDLGFGLWIYSDRFYLGLSGYKLFGRHSNNGLKSYDELLALITAGYRIPVGVDFAVIPSVLLQYSESGPLLMNGTAFVEYRNRFSIGASYRHDVAVVGMLRFALTSYMAIGYGYDFTTSDLNGVNNGSHEISLGFVF